MSSRNLENNPNLGGGKRTFPGKPNPKGNVQDTLKVMASIHPDLDPTPIKFRAFDVDDPWAKDTVVDNDMVQDTDATDNRGDVESFPNDDGDTNDETEDSTTVVNTNANGVAKATFKVTMRPGDNFRVVARRQGSMNAIEAKQGSDSGELVYSGLGSPVPKNFMTKMLTTWRDLHVEVDEMQAPQGNANYVTGAINSATYNANTNRTTLNIPDISTSKDDFDEEDHFNKGSHIQINGVGVLDVEEFDAGSTVFSPSENVYVQGNQTNASGKDFQLYDDDYEYVNNTFNLHVPVPKQPNTSHLATALADAYVRPKLNKATSPSGITFIRNIDSGSAVQTISNMDRQMPATNASEKFWSGYVCGAFQDKKGQDNDPIANNETLGRTDVAGDYSSLIYLDTTADSVGYGGAMTSKQEKLTVVHEIGHFLTCKHDDEGVMVDQHNVNKPEHKKYSPDSLKRIRGDAFDD